MDSDIYIFILLIFLSSLFSASEVAYIAITPARVESLVKRKYPASHVIQRLKRHSQRLLIVILIGNNLVNIGATVFMTNVAIELFGKQSLAAVTGLLTFLILVFGEIVPKTYAQRHAPGFAMVTAYPLLLMSYILFPVVWVFENFIKGLSKLTGKGSYLTVTEEELLALVDIGKKEGTFEAQEKKFIENVLEFHDTNVEEIMTVRASMDVLRDDRTIAEAIEFFKDHNHTRIPVFHERMDNIVGLLTMHHVIEHATDPDIHKKKIRDIPLIQPLIVPSTRLISSLFRELQARRVHMAMVVDEHGTIDGLVTLEDILEEIVGEIEDERESEENTIQQVTEQRIVVDGSATLEEIEEALGMDFSEETELHRTVSYMILKTLHRFPKEGEKVQFLNLEATVLKMGKRRIEQVELEKLPHPEGELEGNRGE